MASVIKRENGYCLEVRCTLTYVILTEEDGDIIQTLHDEDEAREQFRKIVQADHYAGTHSHD